MDANLALISSLKCLEDMLAGLWVVDEWVVLRPMDELEVLCARLAKDGF